MKLRYRVAMEVILEVEKGEIPNDKWFEVDLGKLDKEKKRGYISNYDYIEVEDISEVDKDGHVIQNYGVDVDADVPADH